MTALVRQLSDQRSLAPSVVLRTAAVRPPGSRAQVLAQLTIEALDPGPGLTDPELVEVREVGGQLLVHLRDPLAGFARRHGCRRVLTHCRTHRGEQIVTVVLVRHRSPVEA